MAGHAGLHRVVKTVAGKKGSVHRAYWIADDPRAKQQATAATRAANRGTHDARVLAVKRAALTVGMAGVGAFMGPRVAQAGMATLLAAATAMQHGAAAHQLGRTQGNHQITSSIVTFGEATRSPLRQGISVTELKQHVAAGHNVYEYGKVDRHESFIAPVQNLSGKALRDHTMTAARMGASRGMQRGLQAYGNPALMAASRVGGAITGAYIGHNIAQSVFRAPATVGSRRR